LMSGRVYFESTETYVFDSEGRLLKAWFACNGCGKIHESRKSAEACCNPNAVVNDRYHVCMRCGSVFTTASAFEDHRARGCVKVVNEAKNTRELHACLSCGATLTSRAALESHLRWHESRAPETKIVFTQDGRLISSAFMTGKPQLRFISEALNSRDQLYCFRCGNPLPANLGIRIMLRSGRLIHACLSCYVLASFGDL
jgi:hypothetical protein